MAIKDRRLFANGGEATSPIVLAADTGSGFVPSNKKVILEQEGDSFFAVTTEDGIVLDREQINIDLVKTIIKVMGASEDLIEYVDDRPGHDLRYAIDNAKIRETLNFRPDHTLEEGLRKTITWYQYDRI